MTDVQEGQKWPMPLVEMICQCNLFSGHFYIDKLYGIPFNIEVFFPALSNVLSCIKYSEHVSLMEPETVADSVFFQRNTIELSGDTQPSTFLGYGAPHSVEELFYDESGALNLYWAAKLLLTDLIKWRMQYLQDWEYVLDGCYPVEIHLWNEENISIDRIRTRGDGELNRRRTLHMGLPVRKTTNNEDVLNMDKYITEEGFITTAPIIEEEPERKTAGHVTFTSTGELTYNVDFFFGGDTGDDIQF